MKKKLNSVRFSVTFLVIFILLCPVLIINLGEPEKDSSFVENNELADKIGAERTIRSNIETFSDFSLGTLNGTILDTRGNLTLGYQPRQEPYEMDANTLLLSHFDNTCDGEEGEVGFNVTNWLYDWENEVAWKYRKQITIQNSGSDLSYYPVNIILNSTNFDYSKAAPNGDDIRFKDITTNYHFSYWIEYWLKSDESSIWINIPDLTLGTYTIYMFYGNPLASPASHGNAVFDGFDGFEGPAGYDPGYWNGGDKLNGPMVYSRSYAPKLEGSSSLATAFTNSLDYAALGHAFPVNLLDKRITLWMYDDLRFTNPSIVDLSIGADSHYMRIRTNGGNYRYEYWDGVTLTGSTISPRTTGWHKLHADLTSTNGRLYFNDSLVGTRNFADFNRSTIAYQPNWGMTCIHYYDSYFVRKKASTEPTTTVELTKESLEWTPGRFGEAHIINNYLTYPNIGVNDEQRCAGFWRFDEGSGVNVIDDSINSNNGILEDTNTGNGDGNSPPQRNTGKFGNALKFDGIDDRIIISDSSSLSISDDITISAWVKFTELPKTGDLFPILRKRTSSSDGYDLFIDDEGKVKFVIDVVSGTGIDSTTSINDGNWHFITGTWDQVEMNLYIDGKVDAGKMLKSGSMSDTDYDVCLGWDSVLPGEIGVLNYYNGTIDEVYIYNYAKNAEEVYSDYLSEKNLHLPQGTIDLWVKPNWMGDDGNVHTIFFSGADWNRDSFYIYKGSDNNLKFMTSDELSNNQDYPEVDISDWQQDTWYHLAFTWDATGKKEIYINGELTKTAVNNYMPDHPHAKLCVGGRIKSVGGLFDGAIDELRISDHVRAPNEFREFYPQGEYVSQVIDATEPVDWEIINWNSIIPSDTTLFLQTRHSNDNINWTSWTGNAILENQPYKVYLNNSGEAINAEHSRFLQWRAIFKTSTIQESPVLDYVNVSWNHLPKISNLSIIPVLPTTEDELSVTYNYSDLDNELEIYPHYEWFVDRGTGFVSSGITTRNIISNWTSGGEHWFCRVTLHDGKCYGPAVNSPIVTIVSGGIVDVDVTPGKVSIIAGETIHFSAKAYDMEGHEIITSFDWSVAPGGSIDQTGKFTANFTNTYIISAEIGDIVGYGVVIVGPGPISKTKILPENPNVLINDIIDFEVLGTDSFGNEVTDLILNWSISGNETIDTVNGTYTATKLGTWEVRVNASGILATTNVNVLKGELARITLSPQNQEITADDDLQFTANAFDQFDNEITKTFIWWTENGVITETGLFTPREIGTWQIKVSTLGSAKTATTNVTVTHGAPTDLILESSKNVIKIDEACSFSFYCMDSMGNRWQITDGINLSIDDPALGSFDANNNFNGASAGQGTITATLDNATGSGGPITGEIDITILSDDITPSPTDGDETDETEGTNDTMFLGIIIVLIIVILILLFLFLSAKKSKGAEEPEESEEVDEEAEVDEELEEDSEAEAETEAETWKLEEDLEAEATEPEEIEPEDIDLEEQQPLDADVGEEDDFGEELFDEGKVGTKSKKPKKGAIGKPVKKKSPAFKQKILKPDLDEAKRGPGKPYLHKIDKVVKCNICLGNIKGGLPTLTCTCGKHYHENCAKRVVTCPVCETSLNEPVEMTESDEE